jgi:hypothetical protein
MSYLSDQALAFLQKRCTHPGHMVAFDILEGCAEWMQVGYCNRCGAVRIRWEKSRREPEWRRPDPNLWRG